MFVSYFISGYIPLGPYVFLPVSAAFPISIMMSLLFLFILFCNLLSLIPGFLPPTATLKTNVALALLVFALPAAGVPPSSGRTRWR